jgi:hypothetical protein
MIIGCAIGGVQGPIDSPSRGRGGTNGMERDASSTQLERFMALRKGPLEGTRIGRQGSSASMASICTWGGAYRDKTRDSVRLRCAVPIEPEALLKLRCIDYRRGEQKYWYPHFKSPWAGPHRLLIAPITLDKLLQRLRTQHARICV